MVPIISVVIVFQNSLCGLIIVICYWVVESDI